ncbi:MAG: TonB-dependent receptor [Bacteroidetes bacterium]|nr:TonB-dependent receptor [Bacteroidota bacterium]
MVNCYLRRIIPLLFFCLAASSAFAQTSISGKVIDAVSGEPLIGVNIVVKGKVIGTVTDGQGEFNLKVSDNPPFKLSVSYVTHRSVELEVTQTNVSGLEIKLEESNTSLFEVTVTGASLTEESVVKSPVSIEKMNSLMVQNTASDNYYKGLINLKGVDMTTSSINFQIINARGFGSTGNTRFVQLTDGMDTQAPALNFPIGNLNGPSELDVESVEMIPGSASALYGPNAFNGILLVNSKSPFEYQGLSAFIKSGLNHVGDSDLDADGTKIGPGSSQNMFEGAMRYAKAWKNKFAVKVAFSYNKATDWYGTNLQDRLAANKPEGFSFNPGSDKIHAYGDEVSVNLALVGLSSSFVNGVAQAGLGAYLPDLPNMVVSRTPYDERYLVDYGAKNLKTNIGLHYRPTDKLEVLYNLNLGAGTSVYTGAQRYSLRNFNIQQHKLELKGDNFFLRGYTTIENSGESYIADLAGVLINTWDPTTQAFDGNKNSAWFGDYAANYLAGLAVSGAAPGAATTAQQEAAHKFARQQADLSRIPAGSAEFEKAKLAARKSVIPSGALFDDQTALYHAQGQYNFKNQIKFMDLIAGATYRLYDLNSNGTIFADTKGNDITIQEVGAYAQGTKKLFDDKLKLIGSLRYDKNQNFNAQINPRLAAVISPTEKSNIRIAFQSGFRNPTTQNQHIDLNVVSARLIGGLPYYAQKYNVLQNAYTLPSVNAYISQFTQNISNPAYLTAIGGRANSGLALGDPSALKLLQPVTEIKPVKPEQIKSVEFGYNNQIGNLFFDVSYYYNRYNDFIAGVFVRKAAGAIDLAATSITEQNVRNAQTLLTPVTTPGQENTFSVASNIEKTISSQGAAIGLNYLLGQGYNLGANYSWNKLNEELGDGFLSEFNTPEHKYNVTFGNRRLTKKLGFNLAYRWQQNFLWESSFGIGEVPSVGTLDGQISIKLKDLKSTLKIGGSNLLNQRYVLNYGGPTLGAIYYVSFTFDELLN